MVLRFDCKDVVSEASGGAVTACRSVSCVAFARSTASVRLGWFDSGLGLASLVV